MPFVAGFEENHNQQLFMICAGKKAVHFSDALFGGGAFFRQILFGLTLDKSLTPEHV